MPPSRVAKPVRLSSTQRRQNAVSRIQKLGRQLFAMGRCTSCIQTDSVCWMMDGQSMCSTCRSKNKKVGECDGCFSVLEFDSLQDQRDKMQKEVEDKDRQISGLIAALMAAQKEKDRLQQDMQRMLDDQKRMLSRELEVLDAIDAASVPDASSARFAYSLDGGIVPSLRQMVDFENGTWQSGGVLG